MSEFHLKEYIQKRKQLVDEHLDRLLPQPEGPSGKVVEAMRYSISAGGKRVRPILMMAACEAVGGDFSTILPAACAMECVHTYSLIHDDLPAMDDDDLRRGKPTCHKVFGEAIAILAGDGLLTYAFELMTHPELTSYVGGRILNQAISIFAKAAGVAGMVGGQTADILFEDKPVDAQTLAYIHRHKTGALIRASVEMGALLGGGTPEQVERLSNYGTALGLAFQVVDDLLDVIGDEKKLGKPVGSDEKNKKATYPALFGIEETRKRAQDLKMEALDALSGFGSEAEPLRAIAIYVVERDR
ncbi:MAG: polyprenyl synthetase family protein [Thermodesulfobacteria bacterium]|nr:polyprenyl synthetase family protein [Thermodesulfobacteriota bacterium]